eukprot:9189796-Pyramimonas_sp.AAC.2
MAPPRARNRTGRASLSPFWARSRRNHETGDPKTSKDVFILLSPPTARPLALAQSFYGGGV